MTAFAVLATSACAQATAQTGSAAPVSPPSVRSEAVTLTTPTGALHGTLLVPETGAKSPVALIHAGSGPTDRDGNSRGLPGANNSLKLLAEALAARGVASVRFDKRGIGESQSAGAREEDLRFDALIDDAAAWVRQLRSDMRFSTVTVIGHSEGSLIGMVAANRAGAHAFVSIAGAGRAAQDILREQLARQLPPAIMAQAEKGIGTLAEGRLADSTPPALASLFRPSVQPYLISWFRFDPAKEIAALKIPILIAQGTTDLQVTPGDANRLAAAAPGAKLLLIDGMNHVLKSATGDRAAQMPSYSDPTLPVEPRLVDAVVELVRSAR